MITCHDSTTRLENIAVTALAQNANSIWIMEIAVNRKFHWDLIWNLSERNRDYLNLIGLQSKQKHVASSGCKGEYKEPIS